VGEAHLKPTVMLQEERVVAETGALQEQIIQEVEVEQG
jgi:hypothetical protein